jgi:KipI family sensor histidine kinase inhibitor
VTAARGAPPPETFAGPRRVHRVGELAVLVECADVREVIAVHDTLVRTPLPGQSEVQAAAATVLVVCDDARTAAALAPVLSTLTAEMRAAGEERVVHLDVVYDGEDLDEVARIAGLSREGVVQAHTGGAWSAAFAGFAPGFVYLTAADGRLTVPRRATPRTVVPAGSVAVAAGFSAVYPRASPGGWQLLGRTSSRLWDPDGERPALITPGDQVLFRAVRDVVIGARGAADVAASPGAPGPVAPTPEHALVVVSPGVQSLIEDAGRPRLRDLGVTRSGAMDRGAAARANRLVGNPRAAAVIEAVLGGLELQAVGDHVVAVTGAAGPVTVHDGARAVQTPAGIPFPLLTGQVLAVPTPASGMRTYVAVRGGVGVPAVLGSRSTDVLSGLGPEPLAVGAVLGVAPVAPGSAVVGSPEEVEPVPDEVVVRLVPGPRDDWFTPQSIEKLYGARWTVTPESNRVGLRLDGEPLVRATEAELPSEGIVRGSVQVPPSGRPVVLLADHPVTGGYPVVGVVVDRDLDRLGQLRTGDRLTFVVA